MQGSQEGKRAKSWGPRAHFGANISMKITGKLGVEGFAASNGWLESFKRTQNICTMSVTGEEGDVNSLTLESGKEKSRELIRGWKPENVWNIDETGCFWKSLPEVSLNKKGRCSGGKQSKQRNTWAFLSMRQVGRTILS